VHLRPQCVVGAIPHVSRNWDVVDNSEVVVVGNNSPELTQAVMRYRPEQVELDLGAPPLDVSRVQAQYNGISW
jgi:hypothetical protein